jgi:hypothetical protein
LVGIPLALAGGYSTYHANFSPEAKCQSLRASIVSMLDKKTDATTLRLLVQRDVVTFERECGAFDADAAAAFKTLLASEKTPAVAHRAAPPAKIEKAAKVEAVMAEQLTKSEKAEKIEKAEKREPIKREAVKHETPAKEISAKETPAQDAVAKLGQPTQLGTPPQLLVAPPAAAEKIVTAPAGSKKAVEEAKPAGATAVQPQTASVDAKWVASVRDVLRESASQPAAAETTSDVAAPTLGAPINISPEPQVANGEMQERRGEFVPPADVGPASRALAPRPPAPIPNAN